MDAVFKDHIMKMHVYTFNISETNNHCCTCESSMKKGTFGR